jgi:cytochrome c6
MLYQTLEATSLIFVSPIYFLLAWPLPFDFHICYIGGVLSLVETAGRYLRQICTLILTFVGLTLAGSGWVQAQSAAEGQKLYTTYCSSCHGDKGRGDGAAGKALPIKPADHTDGKLMNSFSDEFLLNIIAKGGAAVGKSAFMPAWGGVLKESQIQDLITYMRSIASPQKASGK